MLPDVPSLYHIEISQPKTSIEIVNNEQTGEVTGFKEFVLHETDSTPHNSTSLQRQPASREDFTR